MSDLAAFTAEHTSRLTGLTVRRLYEWDKTGLFNPHYADDVRRHPYSRIYSFRDIVALRTLSLLTCKYGISTQRLRKANEWLTANFDNPWSELKLYVRGRDVLFEDPATRQLESATNPGQLAFTIEIEEIAHEVRKEADKLRQREPNQIGRIERHRFVVHNAPVVAGTRIQTSVVWSFREKGYTVDQIQREFPQLTTEDVEAAIIYEEHQRRRWAS